MVEYVHRKNDTIDSYTNTYFLKEDRIRVGNNHYLIVREMEEDKKEKKKYKVKGIVVKGRIDTWKTRRDNNNYISEISLLSQLAKKNKKYERVIDNLEKRLSEKYEVSPLFC